MSDDQKSPEDQPSKQDSDNINISDIGEESILAVGRNAVVKVVRNTFVVDGNLQWIPVFIVLLFVIGILSLLLWQLQPDKQTEMTKFFNVAVAEFLVVDENGKPYRSEDGLNLASSLKEQLETKFVESKIENIATWELWGPKQTGKIEGATPEEREANARAKAGEINAHIIFYGVLTFNGEISTFTPEFYVNHVAFGNANELTGRHALGNPLGIALPLASQIQTVENLALASRAKALSLITIGLAYYVADNFDGAIEQFSLAEEDKDWFEKGEGKEVVYLLLGNAYSRLIAQDLVELDLFKLEQGEDPNEIQLAALNDIQLVVENDIRLAAENYEKAIAINDNYGRAYIGLAGTKLAKTSNSPQGMQNIQEAEALLDQAMALEDQPETANIEPKTHYYRGQIAFLKAIYSGGSTSWFETAKKEYRVVIDSYEQGNLLLRDFASQSYARLGVIASLYKELDPAIENLEIAISIATPFSKGEFYKLLGQVYCGFHQEQEAINAFEKAIQIAKANRYRNSISLYEKELDSLSCEVEK